MRIIIKKDPPDTLRKVNYGYWILDLAKIIPPILARRRKSQRPTKCRTLALTSNREILKPIPLLLLQPLKRIVPEVLKTFLMHSSFFSFLIKFLLPLLWQYCRSHPSVFRIDFCCRAERKNNSSSRQIFFFCLNDVINIIAYYDYNDYKRCNSERLHFFLLPFLEFSGKDSFD